MKKMTIVITDKGILIDCEGYEGDSCIEDAKALIQTLKEKGLDLEVGDVVRKEEDRVRDASVIRIKNQ